MTIKVTTSIESKILRHALGSYPTGVAIVTAVGCKNQPVGMTINSFFSISLEPPLLGWCIDNGAASFEDFFSARGFTVSVLNHNQESLAKRFATKGVDKFAGLEQSTMSCDGMAIDDCSASFRCHVDERIQLGDHTLLVGRVIAFTNNHQRPLVFAQGGFRQLDDNLKTAA